MSVAGAEAIDREALTRELITPEGVDLRVALGSAGQRAAAFLIDVVMIVGVMIAATIACLVAARVLGRSGSPVVAALWLLGFFVLRNGWFLGFELGPKAATPGKRMMKLRVVARSGGRLTADAAFARNMMREIEVSLPLTFLVVNAGGIDGWIALLGLTWSGGFALFPLFNRDRLRVGDLVAGTWVVRIDRQGLVRDLTEARRAEPARYGFAPAQLDAYGVKELQVLESVIRRNSRVTTAAVAARIRDKIGWMARPDESDGEFLDAYYAALRRRLEGGLLLGRRRRDKHDAG